MDFFRKICGHTAAVTAALSGVLGAYDFTGSFMGVGDFKKLFDMAILY